MVCYDYPVTFCCLRLAFFILFIFLFFFFFFFFFLMASSRSNNITIDILYTDIVLYAGVQRFLVTGGFERSNGIVYQQVLDRFNGSATATAWVTSIFSTLRLILGKLNNFLACFFFFFFFFFML